MSNKGYYFHSLRFVNYRSLENLEIDSLRRINLIGGFNGSGKTTLLEGLFFVLDRRSPMGFARPHAIRNIGFAGRNGVAVWFSGQKSEKEIEISAKTNDGDIILSMKYGKPPSQFSSNFSIGQGHKIPTAQQTRGAQDVLLIEAKVNNNDDDLFYIEPRLDGLNYTPIRSGRSAIPIGVILTAGQKANNDDIATRFSDSIRENRVPELLDILKDINKDIVGFELLHEAGVTALHAKMKDGKIYPTPMLGDGFMALLSIALMIMSSRKGVVLLDEFDSAIHYSVIHNVWSHIARLARKYECQIFAVTHSIDCIKSAFKGVNGAKCGNDFQYLRLERVNGKNNAVSYSSDELESAINADWEVR